MNMFGEWFEELGKRFKGLLEPFKKLADYIQDLFVYTVDSSSYLDTKKKLIANTQKQYRKYMDVKYRVKYQQYTIIKSIPKNLPYQRRRY